MKKYILVAATILALSLTACKDWLDINYNPNAPGVEQVESDIILPAAEAALATTLGVQLQVIGGYQVQYYAQQFGTPNFINYSQFNVSGQNTSTSYTQLYQKVIQNTSTVRTKAMEQKEWGTYLAATVIRAYAFQLLVDMYGETPYSESMDISKTAPKFDDGQVVYEGILAELDEALSKVNESDLVATNFTFPGKNAAPWIGFANAQKLKMLTRLNMVKDVNARIKEVIDGGQLPMSDIAMAGCWSDAKSNANPFYSEHFAKWGRVTGNIIGNIAIINTMLQTNSEGVVTYTDPRLSMLFKPNGSGNYVGGISGDNFSTADAPYNNAANYGEAIVAYDDPVYFITRSEVCFWQAEYYAKTGDAAQAQSAYEDAIKSSLSMTGGDPGAVLARFPYDNDKWAECIGVSKWLALACVNNFESYTEVRRLKYPAFGSALGSEIYNGKTVDLSKYTPGTLYTPYQRYDQVGDNHLLMRFPYAEAAQSRNPNTPAYKGYTTPIFWAK